MEVEKELKPKKPLSKTEQTLLSELQIANHPSIIYHPFTREGFMLEPKAVALYDYIKGYEKMIHMSKTKNIKQFDMARNLFNKLWPNTYMNLLD